LKDLAKSISKLILEKQEALESSRLSLVRGKDVLTEALGSPEHIGCVSSYSGWKHWPNYASMYRKRKQSTSDVDVLAIKEEVKSQVIEKITKKVTNDVMAILCDQGVHLRSPSNTPSPIGGRKSSCALASDAVERYYFDGLEATLDPDTVDLLTEPTPCSLVINPRSYQMEAARGRVFPAQTNLCSQPVMEHCAIVHIDYVHPKHEDRPLSSPLSLEVRTLGQALHKRVQWRRG